MNSSEVVFRRYVEAVALLTALCGVLLGLRVVFTGSLRYWFIPENLALAWLALGLAWLLVKYLENHRWRSWRGVVLTLAWLAVLPNAWYVLTDFIHVYPTGEINELYDISLMGCLVLAGFILGWSSLYLVHRQLRFRLGARRAMAVVVAVIFLSSFAIYLGRDLRWSSWDVLADPSGLVLNVSDRLVNPLNNQRSINLTGLFFAVLSVSYIGFYRLADVLLPAKTPR